MSYETIINQEVHAKQLNPFAGGNVDIKDIKDMKGKLDPFLIPFKTTIKAYNSISDYGLKKYGNRETWKHSEPEEGYRRYLGACVRHGHACFEEGPMDPESARPHVYAVLWNAVTAVWHYEHMREQQKQSAV